MSKLILIGAGGHSKVVQDIVATNKELQLYAIVDEKYEQTVEKNGVIYANTSYIKQLDYESYDFCIAIGNNAIRKKVYEELDIPLSRYKSLIHPRTVISNSAKIGNGTVIMPGVVINADTEVQHHCIINTNAVVEHDNRISDYVHISPNATLSGVVTVGEGTHVGAGATIIQVKSIGKWCTVGAGAVVVRDFGDNQTVVGVPAKEMKK
ncbi:acetyltransferase [Oceanobacillus limi]|nr:acetyltransferase [Oceanobacillus limi]